MRPVRPGRWDSFGFRVRWRGAPAWLAAPILVLMAQAAYARGDEPRPAPQAITDGYVCPAPPEALIKRRAATGDLPPPSAEDLATYQKYVQALRANDWAFLCRYKQENGQLTAGTRPRVVLLGDSITENWKPRDPDLFVDGVVDRGIGGQTTPQMLLRFYQDVIALRPHVVHILAGTNDIAGNTGPTSDAQFQDNIRAMVDLARAHGIKVILASIPPAAAFSWLPDSRPAPRILAWNDWLRAYAREEGLVFVDYHAALTDAAGGMRPEFSTDGVHPTRAGYQLMDGLFERALAQAERR
jgi:lysophospholipase L1-like esterase